MRILQRKYYVAALSALLVLILLVGVIALSLPSVIASDWFKEKLALKLSETLGRRIELRGSITLELGLSPRLTVSDLVIHNPGAVAAGHMLSIGQARISGPIIKNLGEDFQVDEFSVQDANILVARDDQGKLNWNFSSGAPSQQRPGSRRINLPVVKKISLQNIALSLRTGRVPREFVFRTIMASDFDLKKESSIDSLFTMDGREITLRADAGSLREYLSGERWEIALGAQEGKHHVSIKGAISQNSDFDLSIEAGGEDLASLGRLLLVNLPEWRPYHLSGQLMRVGEAQESITLRNLDLQLGGKHILGRAGLGIEPEGISKMSLDLTTDSHHLNVGGGLRNGEFSGNISISGADLSELSTLVFSELPAWHDYALTTDLRVSDASAGAFSLENLKLKIGKNDLSGKVAVELSPLAVKAAITSKAFDLGILNALSGSEQSREQQTRTEPRIPFSLLNALDAEVDFEVLELKTFLGLEFNNVRMAASLKDGALNLSKFVAGVFGGSVSGSLAALNQELHVKLKGERLGANPITLLAGGRPFIEGDFDIAADIRSRGELLSDVLSTLSGSIDVSSANAKLKSSTLETASSNLFAILSPIFGNAKQAHAECVLLNYQLENGIAVSREQVFKLGEVFIFAEGQLNFPMNELKYNFNVNSTNPALASLIPPFRAFGKLNKPHFVPSISGSVAAALDATEGVADIGLGFVRGAAHLMVGAPGEALTGLQVCRKAYESEQRRLSSRIGSVFESRPPATSGNSP